MLKTFILTVALNASNLTYVELEKYYWDCDTAFMQGRLDGQDTWSCLAVTEQFQKHFVTRDDFMIYWHNNRMQQWGSRGYYPKAEIY
jgi:hypothetical protein